MYNFYFISCKFSANFLFIFLKKVRNRFKNTFATNFTFIGFLRISATKTYGTDRSFMFISKRNGYNLVKPIIVRKSVARNTSLMPWPTPRVRFPEPDSKSPQTQTECKILLHKGIEVEKSTTKIMSLSLIEMR